MATAPKFRNNKKLGNTGLYVSELCLGTMNLQKTTDKTPWGLPSADESTSHKIYDAYAAAGGNFIDTANIYADSEEVLGNWLSKQRREDFVIATKVRGQMGPKENDVGLSRKHIMWSVENSLKKLQTSYIDLYQVHSFDVETPLEETFRTLNDLVRVGKIHYIGISNYSAWQLQKTVDICKSMGLDPIVCLQPQYNLLCRFPEWDLLPVCQNEKIGVIPWSPLAGGWLTGRVTKEGMDPTSRVGWAEKIGWKHTGFSFWNNDRTWNILDTVKDIGTKVGKSSAQVSLRWLMQKPTVTAPIIGARTLEQLNDNLGALTFELTAEQMKQLDDASYVQPPYPWSEYWNTSRAMPSFKKD